MSDNQNASNSNITMPITDVITASGTQGFQWFLKAIKSISAIEFWMVFGLFILGFALQTIASFLPIPLLGNFLFFICVSVGMAVLIKATFYKTYNFADACSLVKTHFLDLLLLFIFRCLCSFVVFGIAIVIVVTLFLIDQYDNLQLFINNFSQAMTDAGITLDNINADNIQVIIENTVIPNVDIIKQWIFHCFFGFAMMLLASLIYYMFCFFSIPLVLNADVKPCKALLLSFKAFNHNWLAITIYSISMIFSIIPILVVCILVAAICSNAFATCLISLAMLFLIVIYVIVDFVAGFYAMKDVFWSKYTLLDNDQSKE
jgi:hypothetical protein